MIIYITQDGDSLFSISERFGLPTGEIIEANGLGTHPFLAAGQPLLLPTNNGLKTGNISKEQIQVIVNADLDGFRADGFIKKNGGLISFLCPSGYIIASDGSIEAQGDQSVLDKLHEHKVSLMLHIDCGELSTARLLHDDDLQRTLIKNILRQIKERGFSGLKIGSGISSLDPPAVVRFFRNIMRILQPLKIHITAELDMRDWYGRQSLETMGNIIDAVILKTYGKNQSDYPCPPAPFGVIDEILQNTVGMILPEKIFIGLPVYGQCWELPYTPGTGRGTIIGGDAAVTIAARSGAKIEYDEKSETPYINYSDENNNRHTIWFEDIRSIYFKLRLAEKYKLGGVCLDMREYDAPPLWKLIDCGYNVIK